MALVQVQLVLFISTFFCNAFVQVQGECNIPPDIPFARTRQPPSQKLYSEGDNIRYKCDTGFIQVGEPNITCRGGQWTSISFECHVVVCGDPGIPYNGKRVGSIFQFGSQVRFECNEGYSLIGRKSTFCQADQRWSNPVPICKVSLCPLIMAPLHGRVFPTTMATFGTVVRYFCDDDYLWTGDSERTCLSNGVWSGKDGSCEASCGALNELPEHVMYKAENGTTAGSVITFKCPRGFKHYGSLTTTCTQNGTWSDPFPTCRVVNCGDPGTPMNGRKFGLLYTFGSSVKFRCNKGYIMRGREETFCQADQTWSNPNPVCHEVQCPYIIIPDHGHVFPSGGLPYRTKIGYSCQYGYVWTGTLTRVCQSDGTWSGNDGTCQVVTCESPKNLIEDDVVYEPQNLNHVGDIIFFSCDLGYDLHGTRTAECTVNGTWAFSSIPRCMMSCSHEYFNHGLWETAEASTSHDRYARFNCEDESEDHNPVPEDGIVKCEDGVWTPRPYCKYDRPWWCFLTPKNRRCSDY